MTPFIVAVVVQWRDRADVLRINGAPGPAQAVEQCAAELEAAEREYLVEELTLQQASAEIGIAYDTMSRKVLAGEITNVGRKGKPLVRRCDLFGTELAGPRPVTEYGEPDLATELLLRG